MVGTAVRDKFLMGALFCNTSISKEENLGQLSSIVERRRATQAMLLPYRVGQGPLNLVCFLGQPPSVYREQQEAYPFKLREQLMMRCLSPPDSRAHLPTLSYSPGQSFYELIAACGLCSFTISSNCASGPLRAILRFNCVIHKIDVLKTMEKSSRILLHRKLAYIVASLLCVRSRLLIIEACNSL